MKPTFRFKTAALCLVVCLGCAGTLPISVETSAGENSDLIMFGGDASRNFVSDEAGLPTKWNLKTG